LLSLAIGGLLPPFIVDRQDLLSARSGVGGTIGHDVGSRDPARLGRSEEGHDRGNITVFTVMLRAPNSRDQLSVKLSTAFFAAE
jgi:hypothetical protein